MTRRQAHAVAAYVCLNLALVFMVLEAVWIREFFGDGEMMIAIYCALIITSSISGFFMVLSPRGWICTAPVLIYYVGFLGEGIEDLRTIWWVLRNHDVDRGLYLVRLCFTLFLAVPLVAFLNLLRVDILIWRRKNLTTRWATPKAEQGVDAQAAASVNSKP